MCELLLHGTGTPPLAHNHVAPPREPLLCHMGTMPLAEEETMTRGSHLPITPVQRKKRQLQADLISHSEGLEASI